MYLLKCFDVNEFEMYFWFLTLPFPNIFKDEIYLELHFKGVDSEARSHSKANYGKFFFFIFRTENQSNFFQSDKGNGQIVIWIMFYKMFTEYILLFYDF